MALLDGKVAIVTGAGRGIGRDHALALGSYGAKVLVNDLGGAVDGTGTDQTPAEQVVKEITEAGGDAAANYDDVSDYAAAGEIIKQALDTWGRLDVLVNNAGILRDRISWNMTEEDWDLVMRVHMKGTFCCSSHALRHWRAQFKQSGKPANGRIINTVSGAMFGNVGQSNYGAAKAGIMGYTIGLALECAQMGVTANAIRPGGRTRMSASIPENSMLGQRRGNQPEPPADQPTTQGAELVCYLASDESHWISGQLLRVGGDVVELNKGWHVSASLKSRDGKPWTAEQMVAGVPKLVGAGPGSLFDIIGG